MKHHKFQFLRKKLRSTAGESLVEVLVALLIAALAILMLGQSVASSARMIRENEERMANYYAANNVLASRAFNGELSSVSVGEASVSIVWAGTSIPVELGVESKVEYYVNQGIDGGEVVSYGLTK